MTHAQECTRQFDSIPGIPSQSCRAILLILVLSLPTGISQCASESDFGTFGSLPPDSVFSLMQGEQVLSGTFQTDSQGRLVVQLPQGQVTTLVMEGSSIPLPTETPVGGQILLTDFDGDQVVMISDLLLFLEAWEVRDAKIDLNGDASINSRDLFLFQDDWWSESHGLQ